MVHLRIQSATRHNRKHTLTVRPPRPINDDSNPITTLTHKPPEEITIAPNPTTNPPIPSARTTDLAPTTNIHPRMHRQIQATCSSHIPIDTSGLHRTISPPLRVNLQNPSDVCPIPRLAPKTSIPCTRRFTLLLCEFAYSHAPRMMTLACPGLVSNAQRERSRPMCARRVAYAHPSID